MAPVLFTDYRIEGQPFAISKGGVRGDRCGVFGPGRPLCNSPVLPIHLPSPSQEVARTYASFLKRLV